MLEWLAERMEEAVGDSHISCVLEINKSKTKLIWMVRICLSAVYVDFEAPMVPAR